MTVEEFEDLVALVDERAAHKGADIAFRFLQNGEVDGPIVERTFAELQVRSRAIAAALVDAGLSGSRALLIFPQSMEFIEAFFGCLAAGVVAVPVYPPDPTRLDRTLPRVQAVANDADASAIITTRPIQQLADGLRAMAPDLADLPWLAIEDMGDDLAAAWRRPDLTADNLAFLQYTSGSTGDPKGVRLSHGNLLSNLRMIARSFGHDATALAERPGDFVVSWLPLFHDMGLIGHVLHPLFMGGTSNLLSPLDFLQKPIRWLRAIDRFGSHSSGAPNFAFDLCRRKVSDAERDTLDLSRWDLAYSGAEPVRPETLERFVHHFEPCGFRRSSLLPVYGLAEASLIVTGRDGGPGPGPNVLWAEKSALAAGHFTATGPSSPAGRALVGCGGAIEPGEVRIVDRESRQRCEPGHVGEIWVAGPNVSRGYWGASEAPDDAFTARIATGEVEYLRTGDLGFLHDGELFVTGRLKDTLIVRGRCHYPQDIEVTIESAHPAIRPGSSAAFSIDHAGAEAIVVVAEADLRRTDDPPTEIVAKLANAVIAQHDVAASWVTLIPPRSIPKTSSGKIQRAATRQAWQSDRLKPIVSIARAEADSPAEPSEAPAPPEARSILGALQQATAKVLGVSRAEDVPVDVPLKDIGLDSLDLADLAGAASEIAGVELTLSDVADHPTLAALAEFLADRRS